MVNFYIQYGIHNNGILFQTYTTTCGDILQGQTFFMLFCKPVKKTEILFEYSPEHGKEIQFRSLNLRRDINVIHHWISLSAENLPGKGWPAELLYSYYHDVLKNSDMHAFIGVSEEQIICLIDVCRLQAGELGEQLDGKYHDCILQFISPSLNAPCPDHKILPIFIRYLFTFTHSCYIYTCPDIHNTSSCRLFEKCGFSFLQNIMLRTKAASLYLMTKNQFHAIHRNF